MHIQIFLSTYMIFVCNLDTFLFFEKQSNIKAEFILNLVIKKEKIKAQTYKLTNPIEVNG